VSQPRETQKARDIIAQECEAGVLRVFPSQWLDHTLEQIKQAAAKGDKSARTAKKLLGDQRFKKTKD